MRTQKSPARGSPLAANSASGGEDCARRTTQASRQCSWYLRQPRWSCRGTRTRWIPTTSATRGPRCELSATTSMTRTALAASRTWSGSPQTTPRAGLTPCSPRRAPHVRQGSMSKPGTPIWDRFWPRVDAEGDCWSWLGARTQGGYGYAWVDASHKHVRAHRLAWELLVGPIPDR